MYEPLISYNTATCNILIVNSKHRHTDICHPAQHPIEEFHKTDIAPKAAFKQQLCKYDRLTNHSQTYCNSHRKKTFQKIVTIRLRRLATFTSITSPTGSSRHYLFLNNNSINLPPIARFAIHCS